MIMIILNININTHKHDDKHDSDNDNNNNNNKFRDNEVLFWEQEFDDTADIYVPHVIIC